MARAKLNNCKGFLLFCFVLLSPFLLRADFEIPTLYIVSIWVGYGLLILILNLTLTFLLTRFFEWRNNEKKVNRWRTFLGILIGMLGGYLLVIKLQEHREVGEFFNNDIIALPMIIIPSLVIGYVGYRITKSIPIKSNLEKSSTSD